VNKVIPEDTSTSNEKSLAKRSRWADWRLVTPAARTERPGRGRAEGSPTAKKQLLSLGKTEAALFDYAVRRKRDVVLIR